MKEAIEKLRKQVDWKPYHLVLSDGLAVPTSKLIFKSLQGECEAAEEATQIIFDIMGKK